MHELSIASSVLELARRHVPAGKILRGVKIRSGRMRGIEPHAMQLAWEASIGGTDAEGAKLELEVLPWSLRCPDCGTQFVADDVFTPCTCGSQRTHPIGGDELVLVCVEVDEALAGSSL
jgi:hydrogenase nickel incorporation protein HypA/HybF